MHLVSCRTSRDGKRAWCQVRPARRRVHGWATPTRSRPERCIPAAQLIRLGPRCSCGDGLSASLDAWLRLGDAALLERFGRMSPASRGAHVRRWTVRREKLGGCLSSARAGQRPPRGYIAKGRFCIHGHHQGWRQPPRRVTESCTGHIPAGVATWPSARLSRRALTFPEGPCMLDCGIRFMNRYSRTTPTGLHTADF